MRKTLQAIFGSSKNTERMVTGAVSGLDKLKFTNEERAEADKDVREWFIRYLEASQPQNLARRMIALIVAGLWAFLVILGVAAAGIEYYVFKPEPGTEHFSAFVFQVLADVVVTPFLMVMGFYFAAHVLRSYTKEKK